MSLDIIHLPSFSDQHRLQREDNSSTMGSRRKGPKGLLIPDAISSPYCPEIIGPDDALEGFQLRYPDIEWIAGDLSGFKLPRGECKRNATRTNVEPPEFHYFIHKNRCCASLLNESVQISRLHKSMTFDLP